MLHGLCDSEFYMDARSDGQNDVKEQLFIIYACVYERERISETELEVFLQNKIIIGSFITYNKVGKNHHRVLPV